MPNKHFIDHTHESVVPRSYKFVIVILYCSVIIVYCQKIHGDINKQPKQVWIWRWKLSSVFWDLSLASTKKYETPRYWFVYHVTIKSKISLDNTWRRGDFNDSTSVWLASQLCSLSKKNIRESQKQSTLYLSCIRNRCIYDY